VASVGEATYDGATGNSTPIDFDPLVFVYDGTTQDQGVLGTHRYVVRETSASADGVEGLSAQEYAFAVTVADKGDGTLDVSLDGDDVRKLDFVNAYRATGSVVFGGNKRIDKRDIQEGETFAFVVREGDTTVAYGTSDQSGAITYDAISYELSKDRDDTGIHTYQVSETLVDARGVTSSDATHTVRVDVRDAGDGQLVATVLDGADKDRLDFVNAYAATGGITFRGTKRLTPARLRRGSGIASASWSWRTASPRAGRGT